MTSMIRSQTATPARSPSAASSSARLALPSLAASPLRVTMKVGCAPDLDFRYHASRLSGEPSIDGYLFDFDPPRFGSKRLKQRRD